MKAKPLLAEKPSIKLTDVVHDMMINKAIREAVGEPMEDETETGRQRAYSFADDIELKKLENELFCHCKGKENDSKANSGILLQELEKVGILRDDPRLSSLIQALQAIKKKTFSVIYGIDNIKLDINQFNKVIKKSGLLISKVFRGQLVIPEFGSFTSDIEEIYLKCKPNKSGKPADYIPQLARGNASKWGVSLCTIDGQRFSVGDVADTFTLQSTSKPFTYALSLDQLGAEVVQKYIGREPSGRTFNEIAVDYNGQPHNPMINSGAIMSAALLLYMVKPELSLSEKFEYVHDFFTRMAGGLNVGFQNSVFLSEKDTADRNYALAYFMREQKCFPDGCNNNGGGVDIKKILDFYFQTCSMEVTCDTMAVMAGTLANGGVCPITGERVLAAEAVKNVLSLMYSCGMYNYSGQFAFQVGLPAKSGVSGIVIIVVPNVVGFATWSPPLDSVGNSARGVMFAEELVKIYDFHTFDSVGDHISKKKNPKAQNYEEQSLKVVQLLFAACNGDHLALERVYLSGLDMNMGDYDKRTALHLACAENHISCVKFLIETCKVDLNVEDRWGNTPLQEAHRFNHTRIVALLKKHYVISGIKMDILEKENYISDGEVNKFTISRISSFVEISDPSTKCQSTKEVCKTDNEMEMAAVTIQNAFKKLKNLQSNDKDDLKNDIKVDINRDIHSRL